MDIAQGQLGPEAKYDVSVSAGVLKLSVSYKGAQAGADAAVSIDAGLLMDELAKKIPGTLDDAVLGLVKAALKSL